VTVANLVAVGIIVWRDWRSPIIYFLVQAAVAAVHVVALHFVLWRRMPGSGPAKAAPHRLREVWRFAAGMTGLTLCGILLSQMDKVVVSRIVPLEEFGYYMIGALVASGLLIILTPVFNAVFPRFSALAAAGDEQAARELYHGVVQVLAVLLLSAAAVAAMFSYDVLLLWMRDEKTARAAAPIAAVLLTGTALNGLIYPTYALQLAHGWTRLGLMINLVQLAIVIPLLIAFASWRGAIGAALVWPILNLGYIAAGVPLTHRRLLLGAAGEWLRDVLPPLVVAVAVAALARFFQPADVSRLLYLVMTSAVTLAAASFAAPRVRGALLRR
ncbi:MAG TPA: oligosaccharide flippase family protein, partial [Thermoanaerobaculia bacterium]|nr:oligosaccharide flippase family protein [Thermoanaerobaculia bacterium]